MAKKPIKKTPIKKTTKKTVKKGTKGVPSVTKKTKKTVTTKKPSPTPQKKTVKKGATKGTIKGIKGPQGSRQVKAASPSNKTVEVLAGRFITFIRFRVNERCPKCKGPMDFTYYQSSKDAHRECGNPSCKEGYVAIDVDEVIAELKELINV